MKKRRLLFSLGITFACLFILCSLCYRPMRYKDIVIDRSYDILTEPFYEVQTISIDGTITYDRLHPFLSRKYAQFIGTIAFKGVGVAEATKEEAFIPTIIPHSNGSLYFSFPCNMVWTRPVYELFGYQNMSFSIDSTARFLNISLPDEKSNYSHYYVWIP